MKVTVILCTYNRCQSLAKALNSLALQVLPESIQWEVIVVDNNSRDQTRQVVENFCRQNPARFRYLLEPQQGKSYASNKGVREARGDIVAFTDDDVTMEPTWLHNLTANLHTGEWAGAGGRTLPEQDFVPPHWLASLERRSMLAPLGIFDLGSEATELKESPFGNNMAFRKKIIEQHGGFRTDLGPCGGDPRPQKSEDSEFGIRLIAAGERLRYEPTAIIYHCVPQYRIQKKYFLDWWFDKARADIQAFGVPDTKWCVAGIPGRLFRRLAVWTFRWITTVRPSRRFDCKLSVWMLVGQIRECSRWRLIAQEEKVRHPDVTQTL
jgi:glycosyltransferase involved in cell wall biosynthesis